MRIALTLLGGLGVLAASIAWHQRQPVPAVQALAALPLAFVENQGQVDARVAYYAQAPGVSVYFTPAGHALRLEQGPGDAARAHTVKVELVGAATQRIEGLRAAPGVVSYFKGARETWRAGIATQARIGYVQPWPGIDLAYDSHDGALESIYTVAPLADPASIRLRYTGHDSLTLDGDGNLRYATSAGEVTETAPVAYQLIDGKRLAVACRFVLLAGDTIGFLVGAYDTAHALIIDPELAYSGFIGGVWEDYGFGVAVDHDGNAYVAGRTGSDEQTFPETVGPDTSFNGVRNDAFIAKVAADGSGLVYAGFIGGADEDWANAVAVDRAGNAYVTGLTKSTDFPVRGGPDLSHNGGDIQFDDAFVVKVNESGTELAYAGFIGGSGDEYGSGIAVDEAGIAYVIGSTTSSESSFPAAVGPDLSFNGATDAFVAKVMADGSSLLWAGYLGGSDVDYGNAIAVDEDGNAYVTGYTESTEASFPVVGGPDLTANGTGDAFVAKIHVLAGLSYAGYIGGSADDGGAGIAVDPHGNAYVAGYTTSTEESFPVAIGPDLTYNGFTDAFVAKVGPSGGTLAYAGYIGGDDTDTAAAVAIDADGNAAIAGATFSRETTFPVKDGPDLTYNGDFREMVDGFVAKVGTTGTDLVYAGYLGGSESDRAYGIAVDRAGNAYVTGSTESGPFPRVVGPDLTYNSRNDAFVAKVGNEPLPPPGQGGGGGGSAMPASLLLLWLAALARRR